MVQWLGLIAFTLVTQVQSLIGELKSRNKGGAGAPAKHTHTPSGVPTAKSFSMFD